MCVAVRLSNDVTTKHDITILIKLSLVFFEVEKSCLSGSPKNKFEKNNKKILDRDCTEKLKNGLEVVYGWVVWELFQIPLTAALKWNATLLRNFR